MAEIHSDTNIFNDKCVNKTVSGVSKEETKALEAIDLTESSGEQLYSACARLLAAAAVQPQPAELLAAAAFLFMIDGGFVPEGDHPRQFDRKSPALCSLPETWKTKTPGAYHCQFTLPRFPEYSCSLHVQVLGTSVLINCISSDSGAYSTCLCARRHLPPGSGCKIEHCTELAFKIKDYIVNPTRSAALTCRGLPSSSLLGLPKELLVKILLYLTVPELLRVSATCRLLNAIHRDSVIWQHLFNIKFVAPLVPPSCEFKMCWYELYRHACKIHRIDGGYVSDFSCFLHSCPCPLKKW